MDEVYERDQMTQLEPQVAQLTEQVAVLLALQNQFRNHNQHDSGSDGSSGDKEYYEVAPLCRCRVHVPTQENDRWRWETGMCTEILEFYGNMQSEEFLDWVCTIEEVFVFKGVPENKKILLIATRLVVEPLHGGSS